MIENSIPSAPASKLSKLNQAVSAFAAKVRCRNPSGTIKTPTTSAKSDSGDMNLGSDANQKHRMDPHPCGFATCLQNAFPIFNVDLWLHRAIVFSLFALVVFTFVTVFCH